MPTLTAVPPVVIVNGVWFVRAERFDVIHVFDIGRQLSGKNTKIKSVYTARRFGYYCY